MIDRAAIVGLLGVAFSRRLLVSFFPNIFPY